MKEYWLIIGLIVFCSFPVSFQAKQAISLLLYNGKVIYEKGK